MSGSEIKNKGDLSGHHYTEGGNPFIQSKRIIMSDWILKNLNKELFKTKKLELKCRIKLMHLRKLLHDVVEELSEIEAQLTLLNENFPLLEDGLVKDESARRIRALRLRRDSLKARKSADVDKKLD